VPFFIDSLRVEPRQVLKPVSIGLHRHSLLLQSKELRFPLIYGTVWKVFLQKSCPKVNPSHICCALLTLSVCVCVDDRVTCYPGADDVTGGPEDA